MIDYRFNGRLTYLPGGPLNVQMSAWPLVGGNWWEPTTGSYTVVAAYQAKGAASLAASYVNLANPGTYNAAPGVAPTFDTATGWTFNGSSNYLATGVVPGDGWSIFVRFSDREDTGLVHVPVGTTGTGGSNPWFAFAFYQDVWYYAYGSDSSTGYTQAATSGTMAMSGAARYWNGTALTARSPAPTWSGTAQAILIGNYYDTAPNLVNRWWNGNIEAVAIYSTTLDSTQVAEISANMAAL